VRHFESVAAKDIKSKLRGDNVSVTVRTIPHGLLGHVTGDLSKVTITAKHFTADGLPLFTEPDRSQQGRAGRVDILLEDFHISGLRIDSLAASIPNCRFDFPLAKKRGQIRLSHSGTGSGSVTILAPDLEKFILAKFHEIKRVTVHLDHGRVRVEGHGEFLVIKSDFLVDAALIAINGSQLSLADAHVSLNGQPATQDAADALLQTLNPVVDLNKDLHLYGAIQVSKIDLNNDKLTASGATTIPVLPPQ
jgi:hypothetical protein